MYTSERWRRNFRGMSPAMKDMQADLKTLRTQIAECERLRRTAKSKIRRDIARLVARYEALARDLERAIAAAQSATGSRSRIGRIQRSPACRSSSKGVYLVKSQSPASDGQAEILRSVRAIPLVDPCRHCPTAPGVDHHWHNSTGHSGSRC